MTKSNTNKKPVPAAELGKRTKDLIHDAGHTANTMVKDAAHEVSKKASSVVRNVAHDVGKVAADVEKKSDKKSKKKQ